MSVLNNENFFVGKTTCVGSNKGINKGIRNKLANVHVDIPCKFTIKSDECSDGLFRLP